LLFVATGEGPGKPIAGAVANNSGSYTIKAPPGTYLLAATRNNYVTLLDGPTVTLGAGSTVSTNLTILPATRTISGRIADAANSSLGVPGVFLALTSTNNGLAIGFTDNNGNFSVPVISGQWKFEGNNSSLDLLGYLGLQNKPRIETSTGSVAGVTISVPAATALFYGSVKDNQNNPLVGVSLYSSDNNQYQGGGT